MTTTATVTVECHGEGRHSPFANTDVCGEAGLVLPDGATHPTLDDDRWDFTAVVGLPVQMRLVEPAFRFRRDRRPALAISRQGADPRPARPTPPRRRPCSKTTTSPVGSMPVGPPTTRCCLSPPAPWPDGPDTATSGSAGDRPCRNRSVPPCDRWAWRRRSPATPLRSRPPMVAAPRHGPCPCTDPRPPAWSASSAPQRSSCSPPYQGCIRAKNGRNFLCANAFRARFWRPEMVLAAGNDGVVACLGEFCLGVAGIHERP